MCKIQELLGVDFSYIFSTEFSSEFLGKINFLNSYCGKFQSSPTFLGDKISAEFCAEKSVRKMAVSRLLKRPQNEQNSCVTHSGRPDEFVKKIAQNVAQCIFLSKA
jgi:hypothetical protein